MSNIDLISLVLSVQGEIFCTERILFVYDIHTINLVPL